MDRLCLFCKHFEFYLGDHGYSELTPSSPAVIRCQKNVWSMERDDENVMCELHRGCREMYKKFMHMAKNCDKYEPEA